MKRRFNVGIVGCGAASEQLHLPALAGMPWANLRWLIDVDLPRAGKLAKGFRIPCVGTDYRKAEGLDAVLIASPHNLHAPMCKFFLEKGVHVLCEKPLTLSSQEASELVRMADQRDRVLAVGVFRRYYPVSLLLKKAFNSDWLNSIESIDLEEGNAYSWKLQSRFMMDREQAGGGVLVDTGSHTIDRLLWWLGGVALRVHSYSDNSYGGLETDCELLGSIYVGAKEIPTRIELSRTRTLRNTFVLRTTHGQISVPANDPTHLSFTDARLEWVRQFDQLIPVDLTNNCLGRPQAIASYFSHQWKDFFEAIDSGSRPLNSADSTVPTIECIEACYARRQQMKEPWMELAMNFPFTRNHVKEEE